jgi:dihydropteroate synthase
MFIFGVCNASPDSLHTDSIITDADQAGARADWLLGTGAQGIDLGGQGSTDNATIIDPELEWSRVIEVLPTLAARGVPLSIDTWRPAVARRALRNGATWLNAADGLQTDAMLEVAAEFGCPVVVPFLHGPDPRHLRHLDDGDPLDVMVDWFASVLARADAFGVRDRCVVDPGTGFAPSNWPWEQRYLFQKHVYSNLDRLRIFGLPIYIALPWKETAQHAELLDIVIEQEVDYGRAHHPDRVRAAMARLGR